MKAYFFLIRSRLKSKHFFKLILAWHILRLKKILKIDFRLKKQNDTTSIDLVIPTISKDFEILHTVIVAAKKHLRHNIGNTYIVTHPTEALKEFCSQHGYILVDELDVLGYGKDSIPYIVNGVDRSGWMFQQLLKLSGEKFVKNSNYVVIDSDTVLLNSHSFIQNEKFVFLQAEEWHEPYSRAFETMFDYPVKTSLSYTSHMMVFNTEMLALMKSELENKHNLSWDAVFINTANDKELSCVSEYFTYANWVIHNFPDNIINRVFHNLSLPRNKFNSLKDLEENFGDKLNSVSFHSYIK